MIKTIEIAKENIEEVYGYLFEENIYFTAHNTENGKELRIWATEEQFERMNF